MVVELMFRGTCFSGRGQEHVMWMGMILGSFVLHPNSCGVSSSSASPCWKELNVHQLCSSFTRGYLSLKRLHSLYSHLCCEVLQLLPWADQAMKSWL